MKRDHDDDDLKARSVTERHEDLVARTMSPGSRARADRRYRELIAEMPLSELRRLSGASQKALAERLGLRQPTIAKMESQADMQVGTLAKLVAAMGGRLEIVAHMPAGPARIVGIGDAPAADRRPAPKGPASRGGKPRRRRRAAA